MPLCQKDTPPGRWDRVKCVCIRRHYSYRPVGSLFHWAQPGKRGVIAAQQHRHAASLNQAKNTQPTHDPLFTKETSSLLQWNNHWLPFIRGVTPSFFTPSLNLISVKRLQRYNNSVPNKLLLSTLLFCPLLHVITTDITYIGKIHSIHLTIHVFEADALSRGHKWTTLWDNGRVKDH